LSAQRMDLSRTLAGRKLARNTSIGPRGTMHTLLRASRSPTSE
jgi:hypothetical protein